MEKLKKVFLFLALLGILVLSPAGGVKAANTGIQISPVTLNLEIKPGDVQLGKMIITNKNDEQMSYVMELEIFDNSSEDGVPSFTAVKPKEGVSNFTDWVTFPDGDSGTIEFKGSKEINFVISVPVNAEPGGHYGAIFAKQIKPVILDQNQVGVAARVGMLALISIPGATTEGIQILDFKAPKFVWKGPIDFKMRVQNSGSVHFDSTAVAVIKNLIGAPTNFELGTHTILPNSIRAFDGKWKKNYPFGYYKVTPTATDYYKQPTSGQAVTIIAIPLMIVVPVLIIILVLGLIIAYLKKHVRLVK